MPLTELTIGPEWDERENWTELCETSARSAIQVSPFQKLLMEVDKTEISIKLSDNDEVQTLNKNYRNKDRPTNVLSFPLVTRDILKSFSDGYEAEILLGDIVMAKATCDKEAEEKDISLANHVSHLVVHGTLHLLGYDHQSQREALAMEKLEVSALQFLDIANPYTEDALKR